MCPNCAKSRPGRQPIDTRTVPLEPAPEVVEAVGRAIDQGQRVYWVCPLVEESETSTSPPPKSASRRWQEFGADVDLVHGRMKGADKDAAMAALRGRRDAACLSPPR